MPPLEAMACGTPAVCADSTCLPEVVGEGNALFFDPLDADALASSLTRLFSSRELRESLVAKSLERAKQYDWRRTAAETLKILETW